MPFLKSPHLDLPNSRIETERCSLVPFDEHVVGLRYFWNLYNRAHPGANISLDMYRRYRLMGNRDNKIHQGLYCDILVQSVRGITGEICVGSKGEIGIWIREDEQGKGYASEVYQALTLWARENLAQDYLVHSLHPSNEASRKLAEEFGGILQAEKAENGNDVYHIPLY